LRYLLCQAPLEDVACGRCKGCQLLASQTHPDLFVLKKEEATQIKVDQVRACVDFVSKTSHFNHNKVVLVEEAEAMNVNASNALLKSLEEPQGNTIFILVTNAPSKLLATIQSRCQTINIKTPTYEVASTWLQSQDIEQSDWLLQMAGGAPLKAKEWAESGWLDEFETVCGDLTHLYGGQKGVVQVSKSWQKLDFSCLLEIQAQILNIAIKYAYNAVEVPQVAERLLSLLSGLDVSLLFRLRDNFLERLAQSQSFSNLNEAMAVEEMVMDWQALVQLARRQNGQSARA